MLKSRHSKIKKEEKINIYCILLISHQYGLFVCLFMTFISLTENSDITNFKLLVHAFKALCMLYSDTHGISLLNFLNNYFTEKISPLSSANFDKNIYYKS
jgi:hypothetical protein